MWRSPEQSVDAVERQSRPKSFEPIWMERQAVDALEQGLHVGGAPLQLLRRGLLNRPSHKLLNAAAGEISERAVDWVDHAALREPAERGAW